MDGSDGLIERQVADMLRERVSSVADWQIRRVQERSSHGGSVVLSAAPGAGCPPEVAIKVFRRTVLAAAEHRASHLVMALDLRVAEPLFVEKSRGVVAARWVGGDTLAQVLLRRSADPAAVGEALAAAGRWLRILHDRSTRHLPCLRRRRVPVGQIRSHVASLPAALPPEVRATFLAAAEAATRRVVARLTPRLDRPVLIHGDFVPQNLVLTPEGIAAIDLAGARTGFREEDIARITVQLAIAAQEPKTSGRICAVSSRAAFLQGYELTDARECDRLEAWEGVELVRRWRHFLDPANWAANPAKAEAVRAAVVRRGWIA
jgi:aminoglycoside phosphotransferase (APT) family kinase protein